MADQPITGLPTKTASGVASTDKMLAIDSAEGYQILVRDVAKYILENCNVSTLAGAVQTPKAAIDVLHSNSHGIIGTAIPATANFNSYTTPGVYSTTDTSQNVNPPVSLANTVVRLFVEYRGADYRVFQEAWVYQAASFTKYTRVMTGASDWSAWEKVPTRAEINALNSKTNRFDVQTTYPSDLNNCKDPGFYKVNPQTQNGPSSGYYSVLVLPYSLNDLAQIAVDINSNKLYCRTLHDGNVWTAWKTVSMS